MPSDLSDRPPPALVALHGYDGTPQEALTFLDALDPRRRWTHHSIQGPLAIQSAPRRYAWFDPDAAATGHVDLTAAAERLRASLVSITGARTRPNGERSPVPVVLVGVSQGAACAARLWGTGRTTVPGSAIVGLCLFSGFAIDDSAAPVTSTQTLVWSDAGRSDDVVPDFFTDGLELWVEEVGASVTSRRSDRAHQPDTEAVAAARRWLESVELTTRR